MSEGLVIDWFERPWRVFELCWPWCYGSFDAAARPARHSTDSSAPHPFLLVDRITELELDKRIVGIKNVSINERYLSHHAGTRPGTPTILTECVAQVGAILILSKPENRDKIPLFVGIERVRYRRPVSRGRAGD